MRRPDGRCDFVFPTQSHSQALEALPARFLVESFPAPRRVEIQQVTAQEFMRGDASPKTDVVGQHRAASASTMSLILLARPRGAHGRKRTFPRRDFWQQKLQTLLVTSARPQKALQWLGPSPFAPGARREGQCWLPRSRPLLTTTGSPTSMQTRM